MSHERDWCAILEQVCIGVVRSFDPIVLTAFIQTDTTFPDEPKLVQRVFASNEVLNNEGKKP